MIDENYLSDISDDEIDDSQLMQFSNKDKFNIIKQHNLILSILNQIMR